MKGKITIEFVEEGDGSVKDGLKAQAALAELQELGFEIEVVIKGHAMSIASLIERGSKIWH